MKKESKLEIQKPEARWLPAIEKRKQPDVLPKSGSGSSSKSTKSKRTDRKRPKQDVEVPYSVDTTSQPSTSNYCSPFSKTFSISSDASEKSSEASEESTESSKKSTESSKKSAESSKKSNEASKKPIETSKKAAETSKKPVESNESKSGEVSKKERQTPKKPRKPSKCPYCPIIMTRINDLRKHVEKFHQGPHEMLCHMCDFRCNDIVSHLAHENDHLCKCPHCGYTVKNYRGLPRHKRFCRMNPNYAESTPLQGGTQFECKESKTKE